MNNLFDTNSLLKFFQLDKIIYHYYELNTVELNNFNKIINNFESNRKIMRSFNFYISIFINPLLPFRNRNVFDYNNIDGLIEETNVFLFNEDIANMDRLIRDNRPDSLTKINTIKKNINKKYDKLIDYMKNLYTKTTGNYVNLTMKFKSEFNNKNDFKLLEIFKKFTSNTYLDQYIRASIATDPALPALFPGANRQWNTVNATERLLYFFRILNFIKIFLDKELSYNYIDEDTFIKKILGLLGRINTIYKYDDYYFIEEKILSEAELYLLISIR